MTTPITLATWTFGSIAVDAAWKILKGGGSALAAVEAGCVAVEDDPTVHSVGVGGLPDRSGQVSLDGSIMLSPERCAGAGNVRRHAHPVTIARHIMERTRHKLLAGEEADLFAEAMGERPADLLTEYARDRYNRWVEEHPSAALDATVDWQPGVNVEEDRPTEPGNVIPASRSRKRAGRAADANDAGHDTVGVLAVDKSGVIAGACSTSGLAFKVAGRVGDSPIIGHGLYVHPKHGAAVVTGTGELAMGVCATFLAVELMRNNQSPERAAVQTLERVADSHKLRPEHQLGIITLRPDGGWSSASLREGFSVAAITKDGFQQHEPHKILLND